MIKQLIILLIFFSLCPLFYAQVGIETEKPEGILHIKNKDNKNLGLVLPTVQNVDSVTTPDNMTPVEATLVYDMSKHCLRIKNSETNWSDCLLDKTQLTQMSAGKSFNNPKNNIETNTNK
ncbi:hypothetical protein ACNFU2_09740 [Chryseobacterium sp. PTM-20240506]|uniref:hypothetical protein n=1 Tax=unclassified Chryseobacterium TaxID=2593645 RepID=UPI0023591765|nr:hypothetical protein [Chryseobacterium sp. B21-037]MDC8105174.1 hypothetical protein [Chryseobacterium sp. B21-037]